MKDAQTSRPNRITRARFALENAAAALAGDARRFSLEHRLFNIISLLNAATNIGGAALTPNNQSRAAVAILQILTGLLFLAAYYLSRFRNLYRSLYWPFVLLIAVFLFANAIGNAGSLGGAHYYFIPALGIAVILAKRRYTTALAVVLFGAVTAALLMLERSRPAWITPYARPEDRFWDVLLSLVFVQIFTAALIMVLATSLNQERKKSDTLLLNILPDAIAKELQRNDRVRPIGYESASVLFTDFVGFTHIAESLTPEELIEELDTCFRGFDQIAKRHKIEKIKTIGDSYMAAGGLPAANSTHAVDCVLAALEILDFMGAMREARAAAGTPYWQLRLGIHSGPLIAGVIGQEKFAYDVWGDTVNTASRLESSGVAGRINISQATYEQVKDFFVCEARGAITAKNKGEIEMYFVNGIHPELSVSAAGTTPGPRFLELYGALDAGRQRARPDSR